MFTKQQCSVVIYDSVTMLVNHNLPHFSGKVALNPGFPDHWVFGTRKAEVLNSLIINTTAKANDTTDILQTFR